jgi:hypothetical protein
MDLICYAAGNYPDRSTVLARLQANAPVNRLVACKTLEELESSLLRPLRDVLAVVLLPEDSADLTWVLTLNDAMSTTRIILVLPSWDPQLTTQAHLLRPRFVTCRGDDFCAVGAVLRKMAGNVCGSNVYSSRKESVSDSQGRGRSTRC